MSNFSTSGLAARGCASSHLIARYNSPLLCDRRNGAVLTKRRFARLLHEGSWLLLAAVGAYFALVLLGYHPEDPGWSKSGTALTVQNPGGRLGAWIADLWFFTFGWSALWWIGLFVRGVVGWWRAFTHRALEKRDAHLDGSLTDWWHWRWSWAGTTLGFLLLQVSSSALEYLRFHRFGDSLPQGAGGVLGHALGEFVALRLGFVGGTLLLLALFLVGFSLTWGVSWGEVTEAIGRWLEARWQRWREGKAGPIVAPSTDARTGNADSQGVWRQKVHHLYLAVLGAFRALRALALRWTQRAKRSEQPPTAFGPIEEPRWAAEPSLDPSGADAVPHDVEPIPTGAHEPDRSEPEPDAKPEVHAASAAPETSVASDRMPVETHAVRVQGAVEKGARLAPKPGDSPIPPLTLLDQPKPQPSSVTPERIAETSQLIESKLAEFGVRVTVVGAIPGPVVTRYEIEPATGVKGAQIVNLAKDLARALSLVSIRVVEIVPGKSCMALEVPNPTRQIVRLREVLDASVYRNAKSPLTVCLGKDIGGAPVVADLAKMPHLLVAGTTGSGKSVGINAMILSLLYKSGPEAVRLIMIDPKMLELSIYEGIPHLLAPVVTDMRLAAQALNWCVGEMERRYKLMAALGVRNIAGFNALIAEAAANEQYVPNPFSLSPEHPEPLEKLPYIVVIVDELADLMMVAGKKIEELIARLAQKARAAGIHLILATQRPSVDVITGLIKANIPTRIAFQVSSKVDSRTILDQMGAETLLGMGDMLFLAPGMGTPQRVHGAFVADDEVHRVVNYLKSFGPPEYVEAITADDDEVLGSEWGDGAGDAERDPLYDQAVEIVLRTRRPSISLVQRHLRIGYNRAARLIEAMEQAGLVSPPEANGNRKVLVPEQNG